MGREKLNLFFFSLIYAANKLMGDSPLKVLSCDISSVEFIS